MTLGSFTFRSPPGVRMPAADYGKAAVVWSGQSSLATVTTLLDSEDSSLLMTKMREAPFQTQLQIIALDSATYWSYAFVVLGAPSGIGPDMRRGMEQGLERLRDPQGKRFDAALRKMFGISFDAYVSAIRDELKNSHLADRPVYNPRGGLPAQVFFHVIRQAYFIKNEPIDTVTRFRVGKIIDSLVPIKLKILKEDLGVSYSN